MRPTMVLVQNIRLDGDTQPRAGIDNALVCEYAEAYRADAKSLPPVVVFFDGTNHWLADGFHRWHAAKAELEKIRCDVRQGTLDDARWFSYSANQTHGLRRNNADKARAVRAALLHPNGTKLSDVQIAAHVGVNDKTVAKYRAELESTSEIPKSDERTGRDGRTTDTAKIGKATFPEGIPADVQALLADTPVASHKGELQALAMLDEEDQRTVAHRLAAGDIEHVSQAICPNCSGVDRDVEGDCTGCYGEPDDEEETTADDSDLVWTEIESAARDWAEGRDDGLVIAAARLETMADKLRGATQATNP